MEVQFGQRIAKCGGGARLAAADRPPSTRGVANVERGGAWDLPRPKYSTETLTPHPYTQTRQLDKGFLFWINTAFKTPQKILKVT